MQAIVQSPPRTILEVYRMLPEGTRAELIEETLYMSPAPTLDHQDIVVSLSAAMFTFISKKKAGKLYVAPVDVYLDRKNAFQPDIVFVSNKNKSILKKDGIYGAPDLVIEVLSPGTKNFDLSKKKKVYESSGVKEYWVINPQNKECLGFRLDEGSFVEFGKDKGKLNSPLLKSTFKF